ncbi:hypothetical protein [Bartonella acomydis]|uniref:hypothetical protein n=1 Tax=Bartonella acomydis TaxID=686234 RepID=UPI0031EE390C
MKIDDTLKERECKTAPTTKSAALAPTPLPRSPTPNKGHCPPASPHQNTPAPRALPQQPCTKPQAVPLAKTQQIRQFPANKNTPFLTTEKPLQLKQKILLFVQKLAEIKTADHVFY